MAEAAEQTPDTAAQPPAETETDNPLVAALDERLAASRSPDASPSGEATPSILDIEVELRFVLGRARVDVGTLMDLADAQVLPMDRSASDPIDVMANGTRIAEGELVEQKGSLGVRITRICAPARSSSVKPASPNA